MKVLFSICLTLLSIANSAQNFDSDVLDELIKKSANANSDAIIIKQHGKTIHEEYSNNEESPIYLASAGKSLTSLAIGKLIDLKLLDSLDQPVHTIYSEWKQGLKKDVTVRMLLNHTSGLQNNPNASIELEPAPDYQVDNIIKLALAAEISSTPGKKVEYNNKAVALLGGIVQELSGKPFDQFFVDEFFKPMDISDYEWIRDKAGNPTVHGAFILKPSDLIKFGELILNKGIYEGQRIISEEWVKTSLEQGQEYTPIWGLLWWRLPEYEKRIIDDEIWTTWIENDVDPCVLEKMKSVKNQLFETKYDYYSVLESLWGENWFQLLSDKIPDGVEWSKRIYGDEIVAYYANGFRGNFLVIVPDKKIVAVRCADAEGFNYETDSFQEFVRLVSELVPQAKD